MFIASAANDTLQGRAIHAVNEKWGADFRSWNGRETIGIPVCKKKYGPFNFRTETMENGQVKIRVIRMYGCVLHSHLREKVIRKVGPRKGWEPFGQWSLKKAQGLAKKVQQIHQEQLNERVSNSNVGYSSSSSEDETALSSTGNFKQLCYNGKCTWKYKDKYDDICAEIQESIE
mmetsp:Transcript_22013/g.25449  ORF Transcript_22013/g.25449 Transcript_22013/m.25449 type:complete len:174 (+) Transcript_22013:382-903(+)